MRSQGGQGRRDDPPQPGRRVLALLHRIGGFPRRHWEAVMSHIDFEISGGGAVYLLHPLTPEAHDWAAEHLPADALRLGDPVAVEWRYVGDVVCGAVADGLRIW